MASQIPTHTSHYRPSVSMTPAQRAALLELDVAVSDGGSVSDGHATGRRQSRHSSNASRMSSASGTAQYALLNYNSRLRKTRHNHRQAVASDAFRKRAADRLTLRQFKQKRSAASGLVSQIQNRLTAMMSRKTKLQEPEPEPDQAIVDVAHRAFWRRMEMPAMICDIMGDHATVSVARVGEIERCTSSTLRPRCGTDRCFDC